MRPPSIKPTNNTEKTCGTYHRPTNRSRLNFTEGNLPLHRRPLREPDLKACLRCSTPSMGARSCAWMAPFPPNNGWSASFLLFNSVRHHNSCLTCSGASITRKEGAWRALRARGRPPCDSGVQGGAQTARPRTRLCGGKASMTRISATPVGSTFKLMGALARSPLGFHPSRRGHRSAQRRLCLSKKVNIEPQRSKTTLFFIFFFFFFLFLFFFFFSFFVSQSSL